MLEYFKTVLYKVSFDAHLFEKELRKAIRALPPEEVSDLKIWCYNQFSKHYLTTLDRSFAPELV